MTGEVPGAGPDPDHQVRIRPYLRVPSAPDAGAPAAGAGTDGPAVPRPFVLTAGRVAAVDPAISLETQVTAAPVGTGAALALLAPELQAIVALCTEPISVAEISARTRLHFGVTRVLVGDLRAAGHLEVHLDHGGGASDPDLILRVIDGLRAIS
ncbi:DUF742 domain-containing protein [Micromonospora costi]|uniref:DUF742 domain-containing protein n=1 Tax=Micromonospora costi TaxID=1530042 RepID=A0A3B0A1J4_9ACTN|nr:DUF742 domain-containing protein [Micromonospora costi]RKN54402.1 DUF742 domain-containing protein [Micromonospora costi]